MHREWGIKSGYIEFRGTLHRYMSVGEMEFFYTKLMFQDEIWMVLEI